MCGRGQTREIGGVKKVAKDPRLKSKHENKSTKYECGGFAIPRETSNTGTRTKRWKRARIRSGRKRGWRRWKGKSSSETTSRRGKTGTKHARGPEERGWRSRMV